MSKFKVGDRVRVVDDPEYATPAKGLSGVVIETDTGCGSNATLVEFDTPFIGGHDGNSWAKVKGRDAHCYFVFDKDILQSDNPTAPTNPLVDLLAGLTIAPTSGGISFNLTINLPPGAIAELLAASR